MSSAPTFTPSSLNWTPATPTLSLADAETVTVPLSVAPAAGDVIETDGGIVSAAGGVLEPEPLPRGLIAAGSELKTDCIVPVTERFCNSGLTVRNLLRNDPNSVLIRSSIGQGQRGVLVRLTTTLEFASNDDW